MSRHLHETADVYAYAATIDGRLYAYGQASTDLGARQQAREAFRQQVAGGSRAQREHMALRVKYAPLDVDSASAVAEMIDARAIAWESV